MIDMKAALAEARRKRDRKDKLDEALETPVCPTPPRERGKTISYSQMSTYLMCPLKWKFHYKDNLGLSTGSEATITGTAVHETLQDFLKIYYAKSRKAAEEAITIDTLTEHFINEVKNEVREGAQLQSVVLRSSLANAIKCFDYFKKHVPTFFPKRGWELVEIEHELNEAIGDTGYTFRGYIDVLLREKSSGRYVVIDFKVSRRGWNKSMKKDDTKLAQLRLYKHFLAKKFDLPLSAIDIEWHIFKKEPREDTDWPEKRLTRFSPANGKTTVNRAVALLEGVVSDIQEKEEFEATPGWFQCTFCDYAKSKSGHCQHDPPGKSYNK